MMLLLAATFRIMVTAAAACSSNTVENCKQTAGKIIRWVQCHVARIEECCFLMCYLSNWQFYHCVTQQKIMTSIEILNM